MIQPTLDAAIPTMAPPTINQAEFTFCFKRSAAALTAIKIVTCP